MAQKKLTEMLDEKLVKGKIIDKKFIDDYPLVHRKMNSIIRKTGKILSDAVFDKGDAAVREWLLRLYKQGASQEKLTGYLRCALAHLSLDFIDSTYKKIDDEDLITRAILSFKSRKLHKTFYKVPVGEKVKVKPVKKSAKKSTAKKSTAKKSTAKKSTAKKSTAKKSTAKKSTAKKSTAKKSTAKKSTAKKSTAKKSTAKKSTAKKSTAKKSTAKKSTAKKSTAKKSTAKKSTAKKSTAKKSTAKKSTGKKGLIRKFLRK